MSKWRLSTPEELDEQMVRSLQTHTEHRTPQTGSAIESMRDQDLAIQAQRFEPAVEPQEGK